MKKPTCLVILAALFTGPAATAQALRTGTWEITTEMSGGVQGTGGPANAMVAVREAQAKGMQNESARRGDARPTPEQSQKIIEQMQQQMTQLPPEQRPAMQRSIDMMRGLAGDSAATLPNAIRICHTQEMIHKPQMPESQTGQCTYDAVSRSGNRANVSFECKAPPATQALREEIAANFISDTLYETTLTLTSLDPRSAGSKTIIRNRNKWVSADCAGLPVVPYGADWKQPGDPAYQLRMMQVLRSGK